MNKTISLLFVLTLGAAMAPAQPPRSFFPWWESPLARDANLTPEQSTQIRAIIAEYRDALIDQRAALEKAENGVEDLFADEKLDQAKAQQAVDKLVEARSALTRSFTLMSLRVRSVLTPEQWRELQKRRRGMMGQGPGPGAGPGPGGRMQRGGPPPDPQPRRPRPQ